MKNGSMILECWYFLNVEKKSEICGEYVMAEISIGGLMLFFLCEGAYSGNLVLISWLYDELWKRKNVPFSHLNLHLYSFTLTS